MLRVVFDSECDEELRVRGGSVYECSFVISIGVSECSTVVTAIFTAVGLSQCISVFRSNIITICGSVGDAFIRSQCVADSHAVITTVEESCNVSDDGPDTTPFCNAIDDSIIRTLELAFDILSFDTTK